MPEQGRPSSRFRTVLILFGVGLLSAGFLLCWTRPGPDTVPAAGEQAALRRISTLRILAREVPQRAAVAGVLEARRSVKLFAETQGRILEVGAEELDRVEEDQLLVQIDPVLAEIAVEKAAAMRAKPESELSPARSNLERRGSLADRHVVSESVLDDAENEARVAEAALRESRAELRRARDDLARKTVRAAFAGVLREFHVEVGEYVRVGQELGELLDLKTARTTIGLADHQVVHVKAGQGVKVSVEAYPNEVFEGTILRVGMAADERTKKFPVEVELPNEEARLLPGMVVRVRLELGDRRARLVVPRDATIDEFGLRFVYVVDRSQGGVSTLRRRRIQVRPLAFRPAELEVISGLSEGEEIAITSVRQLRDGERVLQAEGNPA
jgi:RND family efflux transporter MFP subunit